MAPPKRVHNTSLPLPALQLLNRCLNAQSSHLYRSVDVFIIIVMYCSHLVPYITHSAAQPYSSETTAPPYSSEPAVSPYSSETAAPPHSSETAAPPYSELAAPLHSFVLAAPLVRDRSAASLIRDSCAASRIRDICTASLVRARRAAHSSETAAPPYSSKPAALPTRPRHLHRLTRPSPPRCPLVRDSCTASLVQASRAARSSETAAPPYSSVPETAAQPHSSPRQLCRFTHTRQLRRPTRPRKICNTCNRLFAVTACIMRTNVAIDTTRFRLTKKSELKLRRNKHVRESSDYI